MSKAKMWVPEIARYRHKRYIKTNQEYRWKGPNCAVNGCNNIALSFRDRCWEHLNGEEKEKYIEEIISKYNSRENLRGLNLREVNLEGAGLKGANLEASNLRGAILEGADLREASLDGADLREASLDAAYMGHVRLAGAHLSEASLQRADLISANLEGAHLEFASLEGAFLLEASIKGADLAYSSVGSLGYTQSEAKIERRGEEERLVLLETDIEPKWGTTIFTGVKYNPHTRAFLPWPF